MIQHFTMALYANIKQILNNNNDNNNNNNSNNDNNSR